MLRFSATEGHTAMTLAQKACFCDAQASYVSPSLWDSIDDVRAWAHVSTHQPRKRLQLILVFLERRGTPADECLQMTPSLHGTCTEPAHTYDAGGC